MSKSSTSVVSARVDTDLAERIERLAREEGVTASRFLERLIRKSVVQMEHHGPAGSAKLRLVDEANARNGRVRYPDHPSVSIWELEDNVWPRHFLHVQAEYDLEGGGSSEVWLLWRGDEVEQVEPDEYLKQQREEQASQRAPKKDA